MKVSEYRQLFSLLCLVVACVVAPSKQVQAGWVSAPKTVKSALKERKIALLIGISKFTNKQWAPLEYANNDVRKMSNVLTKYGKFDKIMIRNTPAATRKQALLRSLKALKKQVKVGLDTVVVYISSHGTISTPPGKTQRQRYIITSDTSEQISRSALSVQEIQEVLKSFRSRRIVLMLATCYTFTPSSKSVRNPGMKGNAAPTRSLKSRAMQILSAAAQSQPAFESSLLNSDVYTHFFADCAKKLFKNKKGPVTAIDIHVCALAPTREFVKKYKGTNQVPVVYSEKNANVDVILFDRQKTRAKVGYFRSVHKTGKASAYRILRLGQKAQGKRIYTASLGELTALPPGRYRVQLESRNGSVLESQVINITAEQITQWKSDWIAEIQGGLLISKKGGSPFLSGGMLGLHHQLFGLKLGIWGTERSYLHSAPSQQLYFEARGEFGYRGRWGLFELFAGGYASFGVMLKHVGHPQQPFGAASVFAYGLTLAPCLWIRPSWGIAMQVDAGFSLLQLDTLSHLFEASIRAGVYYRF